MALEDDADVFVRARAVSAADKEMVGGTADCGVVQGVRGR